MSEGIDWRARVDALSADKLETLMASLPEHVAARWAEE